MALRKLPTGLFDLPLELRQNIYGHLVPSSQTLTYGATWPGEGVMLAACEADPRVNDELRSWATRKCGWRRFVVSSQKFPLWAWEVDLDKTRGIEVIIERYDLDNSPASLAATRDNLTELVDHLRRYEHLPAIEVIFNDKKTGTSCEHWTRELQPSECTYGSLPKTMPNMPNYPIVEYLLEPLLQLPNCRGAYVGLLEENLIGAEDVKREVEDLKAVADDIWLDDADTRFDYWYVEALFEGLEKWLAGERGDAGFGEMVRKGLEVMRAEKNDEGPSWLDAGYESEGM
ncbi:hypothetical protein LTR36_002817 [Oleoguttula mirabilis]|uniref:Uncharacterized protein n=1 Tax=Oleoguttula mirabilis TaxID=1507867 RepID=A0AAV9JKC2_9PEZI|nr:hypothetical protein LTR36_002817 [Oleoguttula mirabilis]